MDPKIWGPSAWLFLHTITFNYPNNPTKEDKDNFHKLFDSLKFTIPCPICREHYKENLKNNPIKLDSKDDLIEWLFDIHNSVNKFKGEKEYSHEELYDKYYDIFKSQRLKDQDKYKDYFKYGLLIIIVILLLFFIKKM